MRSETKQKERECGESGELFMYPNKTIDMREIDQSMEEMITVDSEGSSSQSGCSLRIRSMMLGCLDFVCRANLRPEIFSVVCINSQGQQLLMISWRKTPLTDPSHDQGLTRDNHAIDGSFAGDLRILSSIIDATKGHARFVLCRRQYYCSTRLLTLNPSQLYPRRTLRKVIGNIVRLS
jgi:hypothetical protein